MTSFGSLDFSHAQLTMRLNLVSIPAGWEILAGTSLANGSLRVRMYLGNVEQKYIR